MQRLIKLLILWLFLPLLSCSVYMAAKKEGVSIDELNQCKTRSCVISKGAIPIDDKKNEYGEIVEETYQVQKPKGSAGRAAMHGVLDVFTLGIWEAVGTPIEGSVGKKEMYPIKIYYENGEKIDRVEFAGSIKREAEKGAASKEYIVTSNGEKPEIVNQVSHNMEQTECLKSFLFLYCKSYESKDVDNFAEFFAPDATENEQPFRELIPKYRSNMEMIESLNYRIELVGYSQQPETGEVRIKGKFFTQYLLDKTLKEKTGNISMDLIKSGDSYLVKHLNYDSQSIEKVSKQPQWSPWIEVKDKE